MPSFFQSRTPASAPAPLSSLKLRSASATSLTLQWTRPDCHGDPITAYKFDLGNNVVVNTEDQTVNNNSAAVLANNEFTLSELRPDTTYNVRVQVSSEEDSNVSDCLT